MKRHSYWSGIWLAILTVTLILGWRLWVLTSERHLLAVAAEIGSIGLSKEGRFNEELIPNHDGTQVIFYQETETGVGTYFCEPASGKLKLLCEQHEKGYSLQCGMLGWSPDSRYFAIGVPANVDKFDYVKSISIYESKTVTPVATLPGEGFSWDSKFIWLSGHSFARTTRNQAWLVYEQMSDGNWQQTQVVKKFGDGQWNGLVAIAPQTLVWHQRNELWTYNFASGTCVKVWQSEANELESFELGESSGNLILHCLDAAGRLSITLRLPRFGEVSGTVVETRREEAVGRHVELSMNQGRYDFTIKLNPQSAPVHFIWDGMVEYYQLAGNRLIFAGNPAGETPGICQYDISSKAATSIATSLEHKLVHTTLSVPEGLVDTNSVGKPFSYHVWHPIQNSTGQKHPLIIGQFHHMWFFYPQIAANAGYWFASADRVSWWDGLNDWQSEVMRIYEILRSYPEIDTNRIYLIGTSAESFNLSRLASERPELWRGVILLNPASLPPLAGSNMSEMFIAGGKDDADGAPSATLIRYQNEAAKKGIPVRLILQDGVQHITRSIVTERERAKSFAQFLLDN